MKEERGLDFSQIPILDGRQVNPFQSKIAQVAQAPTLATPKYNGNVEDLDSWTPMTEEDWKTYYKKERENEPTLLQNVSNSLGGLGRGIGNSLSKVGNSLYDFGKDIVKGVKDIDTDKMPTLGDMISMYGAYKAGHDPYELTMQQRAGDTPNINPYENYGQRGLNKMEETKLNLQNNLDQAIQNNQLNTNAAMSNANSNARSINTARAMGLAIGAQQRQADNKAYQQYANQIANINGKIAGMLDQQDKMVMTGNQLRDENDRKDRDNFYTQLQKDVETRNKSTQYMGAYLNKIKERDYKQNLVNESSEIFSIDSNGNLKAKRNVEYTPEQKGFLGSYKGAFEDWNKKVAEEGYEFIDGKYYNNKGEEVDVKTKGFPVIAGGSRAETKAMLGKKTALEDMNNFYSEQIDKVKEQVGDDITDDDLINYYMESKKAEKLGTYGKFKFSNGKEIDLDAVDWNKINSTEGWENKTTDKGVRFTSPLQYINYKKTGRKTLDAAPEQKDYVPYVSGAKYNETRKAIVPFEGQDGKVHNRTVEFYPNSELINRRLQDIASDYKIKTGKKLDLKDEKEVLEYYNYYLQKTGDNKIKSINDLLYLLSN